MLSIGPEFLPAEWFSAEAKIAGPESFGGKKEQVALVRAKTECFWKI